jgi:hypothetical protein
LQHGVLRCNMGYCVATHRPRRRQHDRDRRHQRVQQRVRIERRPHRGEVLRVEPQHDVLHLRLAVSVCVHARVRVCVRAGGACMGVVCVCVCVWVCVRASARTCVHCVATWRAAMELVVQRCNML